MEEDGTEMKVNRRPKDDTSDEEQSAVEYNEQTSDLLWEKLEPLSPDLYDGKAFPLTHDSLLFYAKGSLFIYNVRDDSFKQITKVPDFRSIKGKYITYDPFVRITDITNYHFQSIPTRHLTESVFIFIWGHYQELDLEEGDNSFYNIHELR